MESWTNKARSAAAMVEKLFSKDGAKTLLDVGCLPDKDYAVRRKTCAVVGNGGVNLNDPHQGRAIDSVGRCRSTVAKPVLKAPMLSALETITS